MNIAAAGDSAYAVTALHHLVTTWTTGPRAPHSSNIPFLTFHANPYSGYSFHRGAATLRNSLHPGRRHPAPRALDVQRLLALHRSPPRKYLRGIPPPTNLTLPRPPPCPAHHVAAHTPRHPGRPRHPWGQWVACSSSGWCRPGRVSPGRPLGWQPPGPSPVPGVAPLPRQRLNQPATPRLRHSRKGYEEEGRRKRTEGAMWKEVGRRELE